MSIFNTKGGGLVVLLALILLFPSITHAKERSFWESFGCFIGGIFSSEVCKDPKTLVEENEQDEVKSTVDHLSAIVSEARLAGIELSVSDLVDKVTEVEEIATNADEKAANAAVSKTIREVRYIVEEAGQPTPLVAGAHDQSLPEDLAADSLLLNSLNCSNKGGGGKLTTDESGRVVCDHDQRIRNANTDDQTLSFDTSTNELTIVGGNTVDLSPLLTASTTIASLEDITDVASMSQSAGDLLSWSGSAWTNLATSSLGLDMSAFSQFTSATLAGRLSDESGSGAAVFSASPLFTGSVGIGTTTPRSALDVAGNVYATQLTADIIDTGGAVCNVEAYGAVGDNSTINDTAIAAAIADCPEGGTVFFPMGEFRISTPIVLDRPITLRGAFSPRWSYSSDPRSSIRADFGSFSGVAMVHVRDRTISGEADDNNGGRLEHIMLDGGSAGTNVTGIYFEGLVRDWKLTDVDISQTTGNGFEAAVGTGSGNPRGFTIRGLSIYSADGHGFRATALNDSYLEDVLTVGNALRGFYLSSMGETKVNNSRAVFNALEGLYLDGSSNNGGIMFTDFSTDRNDRHGVRISLTGTTTATFNGLLTRRDGANTGGGSETPYAGVAVIGSTTALVAPVFINGLAQTIGVDDSGNPPLAPLAGVRVTNAEYVKIDGQLWGVDDAYIDGGGNKVFVIGEDSIIKTGSQWSDIAPPLYNNKWVAATSTRSLSYDGQINIGSSTDNRLLNIVAPSAAGARFRDTTNDVTFDMRAEDFQGFFGTFSNHQLRFQTNNLSRLTIDTNGNIGIGTTSPAFELTVAGTIGPESDDSYNLGAPGSDWGCLYYNSGTQGTCASDERLKEDIKTLTFSDNSSTALEKVTALELRTFAFATAPDSEYQGLIAQEVLEVAPVLVTEGDDGFLRVRYGDVQWLVLEGLQELYEKVTALTTNLVSDRVVAEEELCVGDACVTEEVFLKVFEKYLDEAPSANQIVSDNDDNDPKSEEQSDDVVVEVDDEIESETQTESTDEEGDEVVADEQMVEDDGVELDETELTEPETEESEEVLDEVEVEAIEESETEEMDDTSPLENVVE